MKDPAQSQFELLRVLGVQKAYIRQHRLEMLMKANPSQRRALLMLGRMDGLL